MADVGFHSLATIPTASFAQQKVKWARQIQETTTLSQPCLAGTRVPPGSVRLL